MPSPPIPRFRLSIQPRLAMASLRVMGWPSWRTLWMVMRALKVCTSSAMMGCLERARRLAIHSPKLSSDILFWTGFFHIETKVKGMLEGYKIGGYGRGECRVNPAQPHVCSECYAISLYKRRGFWREGRAQSLAHRQPRYGARSSE